MSLVTKEQKSMLPLIPEGYQKATIVSVVDLGSHDNAFQEGAINHKVSITWELPEVTHVFEEEKGEQPRWLTKTYTVSNHIKSNLYPILKGLGLIGFDKAGFDILSIAGKQCELNIVHQENDKGVEYVQIAKVRPAEYDHEANVITFDIDRDGFKGSEFLTLPEWQQNELKASKEFNDLPF